MGNTRISMTEFRRKASEVVHQVHYTGEPVILTMKGRPMVRLVSVRDEDDEGSTSDEA
jgi:prevent-host-death family protein